MRIYIALICRQSQNARHCRRVKYDITGSKDMENRKNPKIMEKMTKKGHRKFWP